MVNDISEADFLASKNTDELEQRYLEKGIKFDSMSDFYKRVKKDWQNINIQKAEKTPLRTPEELPHTLVEKDGKKYYIHGIMHDGALIKLYERVKSFIFYKVENHSECLLEQGMKDLLGINGIDMQDHFICNKFGLGLRSLRSMHNEYKIINEKKKIDENTYNVLASLRDERYIEKARFICRAVYLPKKIDIDFKEKIKNEIVKSSRKKYANIFKYFKIKKELKHGESTKRSQYMAECMKIMGEICDEAHCLVGYGHEDEIAYFLQQDSNKKFRKKSLARIHFPTESKKSSFVKSYIPTFCMTFLLGYDLPLIFKQPDQTYIITSSILLSASLAAYMSGKIYDKKLEKKAEKKHEELLKKTKSA